MALRLDRSVARNRRIDLGYGVSLTMRPFGFAEFKEAEAAAHRLASQTLPPAEAASIDAFDDEDLPPEVEDATRGQFASHLIRILVSRFGDGWEGVETESGEPAALTLRTFDEFMTLFPGVVQGLQVQLLAPYQAAVLEGKD